MTSSPAPIYENIGSDYNRHRTAEPSVVRELVRLLDLPRGSRIADIGAGTGNYSNAQARSGYRVEAVEPSSVMRSQTEPTAGVTWHEGRAESLPLPDLSVDGIICTLASHHFESLEKAATEFHRVCPSGPVVILTIDPREGEPFWFAEYFPAIHDWLLSAFPAIEGVRTRLCQQTGWSARIVTHLLPHDAVDITMHSGWNSPEIYLDAGYRQNMSAFALASAEATEPSLQALASDLASGTWDTRHGRLRQQLSADLGFRFIKLADQAGAFEKVT